MLERWRRRTPRVDRRNLLEQGLLPAAATIAAMAVGFTVVGVVLFVRESIIVDRLGTQILALAVMYLLPQFVAGLWVGSRDGLGVLPPIAASIAPVIVVLIALLLFGGPVTTPFQSPGLTVGAVAVWGVVFAGGMLAGTKAFGPPETEQGSAGPRDAQRDAER